MLSRPVASCTDGDAHPLPPPMLVEHDAVGAVRLARDPAFWQFASAQEGHMAADAALRRMTEGEFLEWQRGQDLRYELVDGQPQAMTGARVRHDIARGNAESHLRPGLRKAGRGCLPFGADIAIRVYPGQLRRPEFSVLCPPFDMEDMVSETPRLVFEVLSEGTRHIDEHIKLDEYKALPSLDYIILMAPTEVDAAVWSRDDARAWRRERYRSLDDAIPLPLLGVSLPLTVLYEGIELRPEFPRAVDE
jgi:Uma2 family endonuclease